MVNHHSLADEGWRELVTLSSNFSSLQRPQSVNLYIPPKIGRMNYDMELSNHMLQHTSDTSVIQNCQEFI